MHGQPWLWKRRKIIFWDCCGALKIIFSRKHGCFESLC